MPDKQILFHSAAREKVLRGATTLADAVRVMARLEVEKRAHREEVGNTATKAAVAEGIVPGAGLTLLPAADALEREEQNADGDERMRSGTGSNGLDASTGQDVDLVEHGIIDPTKVVRIGLENAVSVASVLLLTEATLTDLPEQAARRHEAIGEIE
jgi:chaperonin GroEL